MRSTAADRIHAMLEKGTITQEQADELLNALSASTETASPTGDEGQETGSAAAEDRSGERQAEAPRAHGQGADEQRTGESWADPGGSWGDSRHRGRRRGRTFLDMEWVGDMVDGITSGLGVDMDVGPANPVSDRSGDNYRYEWDPRWGRRRGGNSENSSRVEQPEGEAYEFQENRVVFSKVAGLRLVRAKIRDNSFSASTFRGAELTDSLIVDSSLAGASVHDLLMDRAELKDVVIAGSQDQPHGDALGLHDEERQDLGVTRLQPDAGRGQQDRGHAAGRGRAPPDAPFRERRGSRTPASTGRR